jgi:hypothetical protein
MKEKFPYWQAQMLTILTTLNQQATVKFMKIITKSPRYLKRMQR